MVFTGADTRNLNTKEKALKINLNREIYGTFAEIGAGQEVAAEFFKAGRASGTIAKTMSAYDMIFSDAIYGPALKYVSRERLEHMISKEYNLLTKRLVSRTKKTTFFALANTVRTSEDDGIAEGWMGLRFQLHPNSAPNDCIIHIVLKDREVRWQQQALGVIGVNLLFGCYYLDADALIASLVDNMQQKRVEIDMFELKGADFSYVDNRLMSLKLVKHGLSKAAMFGPDGQVLQPSEVLYKRDVLVLRGRFRPVTLVNEDMMVSGLRQFKKTLLAQTNSTEGSTTEKNIDKQIITISEITLRDLQETSQENDVDEQDFMDRVDILCSLGQTVLISNYLKYYKLCDYLSRNTKTNSIGIILGYNNLIRIFDKKYYENLEGGVLEAMGLLFGKKTSVYVYPCLDSSNKMLTCKNAGFDKENLLFKYLYENGRITDLPCVNTSLLSIISDNVLEMLQNKNPIWEQYVPLQVAEAIKSNALFDYPCEVEVDEDI